MEQLLWRINRLRRMDLAEISTRLGQGVRQRLEKVGYGLAAPAPPRGRCGLPWLATLPRGFDAAPYVQAAEEILGGRYQVFAARDLPLGFPPDWNQDPKTGRRAPLTYGKGIDYRDERLVGDIKYLWEINRHLELVTLAQAWHLTGEDRYLQGCRLLLTSWMTACPYPLGVHWTSSLEQALRLVNWSFAWHLLGGEKSPLFSTGEGGRLREQWLFSVYHHLHFIAGHLSRHSSANNHLLGELMGLWMGTLTWPLWRECQAWREQARRGLEEEALRQNAPDGVNREQAIWYHHEVLDMLLLCALTGRGNGEEFSRAYWFRLEAMLEFVASLMDVGGNVPMIGDADDAVMVRFFPGADFHPFRSLLATGAILCRRGDFKAKARTFDDKSRWLLGDAATEAFAALAVEAPSPRREFPVGGYYLLGDQFDTPEEVRIVADAGPLGYLSIAAHGHADALAFTLSLGGREILIDPGTYAYHTGKAWRNYFRGTSAHNTLRLNHLDQSVIGGNFMWTRHARARCVIFASSPTRDLWIGEHDGYRRLADPVLHQRELLYDKTTHQLRVTDRLRGAGRYPLEIFWHFAEGCRLIDEGNSICIEVGGERVAMSIPAGVVVDMARGQEFPPLGWISRRFDQKVPCTTLRCRGEMQGGWEGTTVFDFNRGEKAATGCRAACPVADVPGKGPKAVIT
jgi:hypothetical protein